MTSGAPSVDPDRRRVSDGLISGTAWTAIHVLVSVPVAFLVNIVVARRLGAVDYGQLALLTMVLSLATAAASLGVGAALVQFVTKAAEGGRRSDVARTISGVQGYNLFVVAPLVAAILALVLDVRGPLLAVAIVFGVLAPAALQVGPTLLTTEHRSDRAAKLAIVSNIGIQSAVLVTVLLHPEATSVWIARIAATGVLMVLPFLALSAVLRRPALRPGAPWLLPKGFWAFAVPTGVGTLISQVVTDRVQVIFLQWFGDPVAVGLFALGFGLAAQVLAPVQAAVGPLLPAFAALQTRGADEVREGLLRVTRVSAVATGSVLALGVPLLAGLVPWIYGEQYAPSGDYFLVMACAVAITVVGAGSYASLMSRLRGRTYLVVNIASLLVMAGVALALVPPFGAWGAVASMVCGTTSRAFAMTATEARARGIPARRMAAAHGPVVVAVLAVAATWLVSAVPSAPDGARGWLASATSFVLYLLVLRLVGWGLTGAERTRLVGALPHRARRLATVGLRLVSTSDR